MPVMAAGRAEYAFPQEPAAGVEPLARVAGFPGSALPAGSPWAVGRLTGGQEKENYSVTEREDKRNASTMKRRERKIHCDARRGERKSKSHTERTRGVNAQVTQIQKNCHLICRNNKTQTQDIGTVSLKVRSCASQYLVNCVTV